MWTSTFTYQLSVKSVPMGLPPLKLVETFERLIPGFIRDSRKIEIAQMMWATLDPSRRHRSVEGAFWFPTEELRCLFGEVRNFSNANRHGLRYFRIGQSHNGSARKGENFGASYQPLPWMQRALDDYLAFADSAGFDCCYGGVSSTRGGAISSLDRAGNPIKRWRGIEIRRTVPVNRKNLFDLADFLVHLEQHLMANHPLPKGFWCQSSQVKEVLRQTQGLLLGSSSGSIHLRYVAAQSGRLYATGLNLQNCKREIRFAALDGRWDYDIRACHFAILAQMAAKYGHRSDRIFEYVEHRSEIRSEIAKNTRLSVSEVKMALASIAYGARRSNRPVDAIPLALGLERAQALYEDPIFIGLTDDLRGAARVVVKSHPLKQGRFINAAGRLIAGTESIPRLAAHLLQGVEAVALESAVRVFGVNYPERLASIILSGGVER